MEFSLPLGAYPGRGLSVPLGISYSSKAWQLAYTKSYPSNTGFNGQSIPTPEDWFCRAYYATIFGDKTASRWTTSVSTPAIEYNGEDHIFSGKGFPLSSNYCYAAGDNDLYNAWVIRITVHLPGGESHELRAQDDPIAYLANTQNYQYNWNGVFYATDGSNIKYQEDSANGIYKLWMPDGSYYEFASTRSIEGGYRSHHTVRQTLQYNDRNVNLLHIINRRPRIRTALSTTI